MAKPMTEGARRRMETDFRILSEAAAAGERCPMNDPFGPISQASITALVEAGRIATATYAKNYRVVKILDGKHKGKTTAAPPKGGSPYLVNGLRVDRVPRRASRIAP